MVSMGFSQILIARQAMAVAALPMLLLSSASREWLLELVDRRFMKSSTNSSVRSLIEMLGVLLRSWPMMLVFFRLLDKPNSLHAWKKQLMSH